MSDLHVSPHRARQLCISHQGSGIGMYVCVPAAVSHQPMLHLASKVLPASLLQLWQVQCLGAHSSRAMQSRATANLSAMTAIWAALRGGDIRLAATTSMGGGSECTPGQRKRVVSSNDSASQHHVMGEGSGGPLTQCVSVWRGHVHLPPTYPHTCVHACAPHQLRVPRTCCADVPLSCVERRIQHEEECKSGGLSGGKGKRTLHPICYELPAIAGAGEWGEGQSRVARCARDHKLHRFVPFQATMQQSAVVTHASSRVV